MDLFCLEYSWHMINEFFIGWLIDRYLVFRWAYWSRWMQIIHIFVINSCKKIFSFWIVVCEVISCAKHFKVFQAVNYQSVILIYICIFIISAVCWGRVSWVWIGSGSSGRLGRRTNQPVVNSRERGADHISHYYTHYSKGSVKDHATNAVRSNVYRQAGCCNSPNSNDLSDLIFVTSITSSACVELSALG